MRRILIASFAFLAGCATAPQAPAPQPLPAVPSRPTPGGLIGLTAPELVARFGNPALQVREGPSLKLQFRSARCVIDVYLYPAAGGAYRATHVDTRQPGSGARADQAACIAVFGAAN